MTLGEVLAKLKDDAAVAELIVGLGELSLLAIARERAQADGVDLVTYARYAVQRYAVEASAEEWLNAMGALSRASDPGMAFLKRALAA